jgi:hypothetical protein
MRLRLLALAPLLACAVAALSAAPPTASAAPPAGSASRMVPVGPLRLADTRLADCGCTRVDANTIRVTVTGRDGIATDAVAAAVTVTAVDAALPTFVTAWPTGGTRPGTSTVNVPRGAAVANSAIIPLGAGGAIDLFAPAPVDVVVDVSGVFTPSELATAGRFVAAAPARLLDTRESGGPLTAGGSVTVPLTDDIDVDALAVLVNVTSVNAPLAGYLTGRAAGAAPSTSSFLNPDGSGAPVASSVILPASPAGITIDSSSGGDVVVDLVGWFTGPSGDPSSDGLFVPTAPTRLLDTRDVAPRLWRGGTRELPVPLDGAAAVVTNLTLDQVDAPGFVTAYAAGTPRPATSSVNARARNATVANMAITAVSERGTAYFANAGTDVIVDLTGWFLGPRAGATEPVQPNTPPALTGLLIGDSTLGALNVVPQSQRALQGFEPIVNAAPCRRLVAPSCRSAYTGAVPDTAVHAIASTPGPIDVLVVKAGYNEGTSHFEADAVQVLLTARAAGIGVVLWFTYSEGTGSQLARYDVNNATLARLAASGDFPELQLADWRWYASTSSGWYASDRVHLQGAGAWATADYISRQVAHATHRPCPAPWRPGGAIDDPCPDPDATAAAIGTPDLRGLYGF